MNHERNGSETGFIYRVGDCDDRAMVEIRTTRPEDRRAVANTVSQALLSAPPDDTAWEKSIPSWEEGTDSLSAWDGDRCVAHAAAYRVDTLVPGGRRLPTAAVSRVGCLTPYRRRGIVSSLMRQLLVECRERGQVLSSLRASEAVIYHRFGYGIAGRASEARIDPVRAKPVRGVAPGSMRVLAPDEVLDVVGALYDRLLVRPGVITRPPWLTARYLGAAAELGGEAHFVAVHADPHGVDDGFVHYDVKWDERDGDMVGAGRFHDLIGATTGVELALWSYLCDIDLVRSWKAEERPVDDPAMSAFADTRAYVVTAGSWDEQWLRLLDVDAALAARTYAPAMGSVMIAVEDELFDDNNGVWQVDANGAKRLGGVNPTGADITADVASLAAAYLGGTRWSELVGVGRAQAASSDALEVADLLFATDRAPFCGSFF